LEIILDLPFGFPINNIISLEVGRDVVGGFSSKSKKRELVVWDA